MPTHLAVTIQVVGNRLSDFLHEEEYHAPKHHCNDRLGNGATSRHYELNTPQKNEDMWIEFNP